MKPAPSPPKPSPIAASRQVVCPACGGPSLYSSANPSRPFCSERCKQHDLGAWASEAFRMPADAPPDNASYSDSH